jgi:Rod binding domain-containing protein
MNNGFDILIGAGLKSSDRLTGGRDKPGGAGGRNSEYRKVAREMESLFTYQLLKIMRQASESMSAEKKGMGYNTYMSMFDTEISRMMSEKGLGLQDAIVKWLERVPGSLPEGENK